MKKLLTTFLAITTASLISAELYKPHRFVEVGVTATAGASNNYFSATDYLHKEVVVDLRKIAEEMPEDGLYLDTLVQTQAFINFNFGQRFRLGLFTGIEGSGGLNIEKDLFDLLGKGYSVGETKNIAIKGHGDVFATAGLSYATRIGSFGIKITPTYFVPIAYVADASATVSVTNTESGAIRASAYAPVDIYTVIDMEHVKDDGVTAEQINEAAKNGGIDLSLAIEKPLFNSLDVGVFTRIPIVPGTLKHKMTANVYAYYTENNLLGYLDETEESEHDHGVDDIVYTSGSYKAHRPFRLGAEAAWRPFGNLLTFRPEVAVAARNPYSQDMQIYAEYSFGAELSLFNIIGINASTAYQNQVFVQSLGLMLNIRLLEIDAGASLRGADFANSFNYTGFGAFISVKAGI